MGSLAVLPSSLPLPAMAGLVVTVSTPSGVIFLEIPADGMAAVDTDVLPPDLSQAAINDLCVIAQATRVTLAEWAARHTTTPHLEVLP